MEEDRSTLPPGLCFAPTDEELIVYFLYQKAASLPCYPNVIPDLNLYSPHPWELDGIKSLPGFSFSGYL